MRRDERPAIPAPGGVHDTDALRSEVASLLAGIESRASIGTALGLLAQRFGITTDSAWLVLRTASMHANVKLREVAQVVVRAHDGDSPDESPDHPDDTVNRIAAAVPGAVARERARGRLTAVAPRVPPSPGHCT